MKKSKTKKILFWTTTAIIFLFEGVMPALTSQTQIAKEGIHHLGYPQYFGNAFVIFKVLFDWCKKKGIIFKNILHVIHTRLSLHPALKKSIRSLIEKVKLHRIN